MEQKKTESQLLERKAICLPSWQDKQSKDLSLIYTII